MADEVRQPVATARAPNGMVCAEDQLAAHAGLAMLQRGGTAADAAVAASAVLAVTCPHRCGMGGDLLAVVAAPGADPVALESAGLAGSGADPGRLRAEGHIEMPFRGDLRAVTVPGCVDGWLSLHDRFGRLSLQMVLESARCYALDGFPATPTLAAAVPAVDGLEGADDFRRNGVVLAGTRIRLPGVARALRAIGRSGRVGFYGGEFGVGLMRMGGGLFVDSDMATPIARWRPAVSLEMWERTLWTAPPPSQGYLTLASARVASELPLPERPQDAAWAHLLIEAARQAAWDRVDVLHEGADPAMLLETTLLSDRRAKIDADRAAALTDVYRAGGTTAVCAVDGDRLGVSLLQSNAAGFGAHLVVPEVGVFLHNRGIGFSLHPGHPAEYGPRRRPPHTLSPLAVTAAGGELEAVVATSGGDSQPQVLLQLLARTIRAVEDPAAAMAAGRWALATRGRMSGFNTWQDRGQVRVRLEGQAPAGWDGGLAARGHDVERVEPFDASFGQAQYIAVAGDHLKGASDPRPRVGAAAGW